MKSHVAVIEVMKAFRHCYSSQARTRIRTSVTELAAARLRQTV